MTKTASHRMDAQDVFDTGIVQALALIKEHILHDAVSHNEVDAILQTVEQEIKRQDIISFARTCVHALRVQLNLYGEQKLAPAWAQAYEHHPDAVFDALRCCFDETVANALARELPLDANASATPTTRLWLRLGVARPAISDSFAQSVAHLASQLTDGLAILCQWRCTGKASPAQALAAINAQTSQEEALQCLVLMNSDRALPAAQAIWAKHPCPSALAILCTHAPTDMGTALQDKRTTHIGQNLTCYAWALLGDWAHTLAQAECIDWSDEQQCRALADSIALVSGHTADYLFDISASPAQRKERLHTQAETLALPTDQPLRLGTRRSAVTLGEAAPAVGAPLRHLLYIEHACRLRAHTYIDASDLTAVQALALMSASAWERIAITEATR